MIQRQQTLWLLLATITAVLTFWFPFATGGELAKEGTSMAAIAKEITATSGFLTLIFTIASVGISFVTIFLFKDRSTQIKLTIGGLLIAIVLLVLFIKEMMGLIKPTPALWAVLPVVTVIAYFMAFRNIRKDEKLVKSLDKLR